MRLNYYAVKAIKKEIEKLEEYKENFQMMNGCMSLT